MVAGLNTEQVQEKDKCEEGRKSKGRKNVNYYRVYIPSSTQDSAWQTKEVAIRPDSIQNKTSAGQHYYKRSRKTAEQQRNKAKTHK